MTRAKGDLEGVAEDLVTTVLQAVRGESRALDGLVDPQALGEEILETAKHLLRLRLTNLGYLQSAWASLGRRDAK